MRLPDQRRGRNHEDPRPPPAPRERGTCDPYHASARAHGSPPRGVACTRISPRTKPTGIYPLRSERIIAIREPTATKPAEL